MNLKSSRNNATLEVLFVQTSVIMAHANFPLPGSLSTEQKIVARKLNDVMNIINQVSDVTHSMMSYAKLQSRRRS